MSDEEDGHEYFSTVIDLREYLNKRIDNLKRILDQRHAYLNLKLDELELQVRHDDSQNRQALKSWMAYEKSTSVLDKENQVQMNIIKSKIGLIELEMTRNKIRFDWSDTELIGTLITLGNVIYEKTTTEINDKPSILDESYISYENLKVSKKIVPMGTNNNSNQGLRVKKREQEGDTKLNKSVSDETILHLPEQRAHSFQDNTDYSNLSGQHSKIKCKELPETPQHIMNPTYPHFDSTNNSSAQEQSGNYYYQVHEGEIYAQIDETALSNCDNYDIMMPVEPAYEQVVNCRSKRPVQYDMPLIAKCKQGIEMGQLNKPKGISISKNGEIFIAEKGNHRVQVFSSEGNSLLTFEINEMEEPNGIYVSNEFVYITLPNKHAVQKYTNKGGFVKQKGKDGKEKGNFTMPTGIDGDDQRGIILVCDTGNNRVQFFDHKLQFIQMTKNDCLRTPLDIKMIANGEFIVLDRSPSCVHFFNSSGKHMKELIDTSMNPLLVNPLYLTVSREGNILLSDYSNHLVHAFSMAGNLIWRLGEQGKGKPFTEPRGLAYDNNSRLVTVCNNKEEMLQIFRI